MNGQSPGAYDASESALTTAEAIVFVGVSLILVAIGALSLLAVVDKPGSAFTGVKGMAWLFGALVPLSLAMPLLIGRWMLFLGVSGLLMCLVTAVWLAFQV